MLILLVWQVLLGHPWGKQPLSSANIIGWTIFLWLIYLRLITVRLVTEVRDGDLIVGMRGLWPARRVRLSDIRSAEVANYDPLRDYGGYGLRSNREGKAYTTSGNVGVRLTLATGEKLLVGSQQADQLAKALRLQRT